MDHYKSDFSNYADDTTPYNCGSTFFETVSDLDITLGNLFKWFCHNNFKANASKCHLFLSPFNAKSINAKSSVIEGSSSEKILDMTIDSNFTFEKNVNELCKKRNLKLHALTRCTKFMSTEKRRLIFKAFIISQFNYCPLVWMFHTKQLNNRINSLFLSSPIMSDIFSLSENGCYNRRCGVTVNRRKIRPNKFGFETVSTIGEILWNDLPAKNCRELKNFYTKDKSWSPSDCRC